MLIIAFLRSNDQNLADPTIVVAPENKINDVLPKQILDLEEQV
jgi:hypothetical protein